MTVTGYGKYDTDTWSISVKSEKTAPKEVKEFIKAMFPKPLGHFITSLFITNAGAKPSIIMSMPAKDIAKSIRAIQAKTQLSEKA